MKLMPYKRIHLVHNCSKIIFRRDSPRIFTRLRRFEAFSNSHLAEHQDEDPLTYYLANLTFALEFNGSALAKNLKV